LVGILTIQKQIVILEVIIGVLVIFWIILMSFRGKYKVEQPDAQGIIEQVTLEEK